MLHIYETETVDAGKKADSFGCCQTECMLSSSLVINHIYEISTSVPVVTASEMVNPRLKKRVCLLQLCLKIHIVKFSDTLTLNISLDAALIIVSKISISQHCVLQPVFGFMCIVLDSLFSNFFFFFHKNVSNMQAK